MAAEALPIQPDQPVADDQTPEDPKKKKLYEEFRTRIDACKTQRRKLISTWTSSIDFRRGKIFASQSDEHRVTVPLDWSLTKAKQASLFSQVPQVRVSHPPQSTAAPWLHTYEQRINDTLIVAGIESVMDEVLPDVINAAGIGAALVAHEAIIEQVEIPVAAPPIDPSLPPPEPTEPQMTTVPRTVDHRYTVTRISPADLLWPVQFNGSDFDLAPWLGRSGRVSWAQGVQLFNLVEEDRTKVLGDDRASQDRLIQDPERDKTVADEQVAFDEIFYKDYQYDETAKSYFTIHRLVFVKGKDQPVIDEPWKGQRQDEQSGQLMGATKFPIRVLTLAYITDEAIPPSDSAIGRPQVEEINKARTQMIMQRERSLPIRWADLNRIDPSILQGMMRGTWQAIIPVQGNGTNIIGEVAKATMPQENFLFDKIAKNDLTESWATGPNQTGSGAGIDTKGEAEIVQSNFQTRIGRERAKVGKFFCSMAEVLGGLLCLYEAPESFGEGYDPSISKTLSYSILADSSVLLDSNQRLKRLIDFINFGAKSGWVNIEPVMKEIASLSGLDPNTVVVAPQPKPPVEPNISLRLTGVEDLLNPLVLAFLMKSGQAPEPQLIEQAKQLINMAVVPPPPMIVQPPAPPMPGGPAGPGGPAAGGPPTISEAMPPMSKLGPSPIPLLPPTNPAVPQVGQAHPKWGLMPTVGKRSEE